MIRQGGWYWYLSGEEAKLEKHRCGKWMYFFEDQSFAQRICEKAIAEHVCYECKCTDMEVQLAPTGVICFYLNGDDIENHKRVIRFMMDNDLIRKTKTGRYYNKVDEETGKVKRSENLIFPRYHQLDVIRKILADVRENGTAQNYLIQHSAGSGKTNSIAWLAHRLTSLHDANNKIIFDNVVIVTDRVVVDRQLQKAIMGMEHKAGLIRVMDDKCVSADLAIALNGNTKIIATTIQKFPYIVDSVANLKNKRFAVIIDEAHSSTAGKDMAAITMTLGSGEDTEADVEDMISSEIKRNGKQANVSMFAFTATPKPTTIQLFGHQNTKGQKEAFHVYSMKQAIEEGFILDVLQNYTEYSTFYQINKEIEDDPRCKTNDAKRQIARFIELHDTNIAQRVEVIVEHFRTTVMQELGGQAKAMVITASRQSAVKYRQAFEDYIAKKGYEGIHAKYYSHTTQTQYDKHTLHSNNMYQIFTYVKNRDYEFGDEDHKVSGMLLYAKTDEEIQPDNVYQMHGNQITVRTLDLNKPFSDIAKQLNTIAETHFDLPERSKV